MSIRLGSTVVNCADLETMTDFWSEALGLVPDSREADDDFRALRGERVNLSLQLAETPVSARDQMHLDLYSDDGHRRRWTSWSPWVRTRVRESNDPDDTYVVLRDPEGNEFCVCWVDDSSPL